MRFAFVVAAVGTIAAAYQGKEVSIGGVSYFVEPNLADSIAVLPDSQKLQRLRTTRSMPLHSRSEAGTQEISIGGHSYFVSPAVAQELATMPEEVQLSRLMNTGRSNRMIYTVEPEDPPSFMGRSMRTQQWPVGSTMGQKEVSVGGVSYFVDPNEEEISIQGQSFFVEPALKKQIADLPDYQKLQAIPRSAKRSGRNLLSVREQAVSIGGVEYMVSPETAQQIATLPDHLKLQRLGIRATRSMPMTEEISIGGHSYFVSPGVAQQLATLPESVQLSRLMSTGRLNRMSIEPEEMGTQEISIDGVSYFVSPALANSLAVLPRAQKLQRLRAIKGMSFQPSVYEPEFMTRSLPKMTRMMVDPEEMVQEVSIGGVSYFVNPSLANSIALLPDAQKLQRIQGTMAFQPEIMTYNPAYSSDWWQM